MVKSIKINLHLDYFARFLQIISPLSLRERGMLIKELFKVILFSLFVFILIMGKVMGQASQINLSASSEDVGADQSSVSALFMGTFGTNTYQSDSYKKQYNSSYEFIVSKRIKKDQSLRVYLAHLENLVDENQSGLTDALVTYQFTNLKKYSFGGILGASAAFDIPLNNETRVVQTKITALDFRVNIAGNLAKIGSKYTNYFVALGGKKYFHTYKQTINGEVNAEYRGVLDLFISQTLSEKFSLNIFNRLNQFWSYEGTQRPIGYYHEETIGYSLDNEKKYTMELGHTNSGNLVNNELGRDNSYDLYNLTTSSYFLRFNASI